jgi:hypothetical protein
MNNNEELQLKLHPRPAQTVSRKIPIDTLQSLEKIATTRDMSVEALLKFYIGQCLRQDLAKQYSERILESTVQVLARHLESEEVSAIIQEIQSEINR